MLKLKRALDSQRMRDIRAYDLRGVLPAQGAADARDVYAARRGVRSSAGRIVFFLLVVTVGPE